MSKVKASKKEIVIFVPGEKEHSKIVNSYPDDHDGEHPAIVTADTSGDNGETNMTALLDGRGTRSVQDVPYYKHAKKGESYWKKGS